MFAAACGLVATLFAFRTTSASKAQLEAGVDSIEFDPLSWQERSNSTARRSFFLLQRMSPEMALFANSLRCNGASAVKGRPSVADVEASQQLVTQTGSSRASPLGSFRRNNAGRHCSSRHIRIIAIASPPWPSSSFRPSGRRGHGTEVPPSTWSRLPQGAQMTTLTIGTDVHLGNVGSS